MGPLRGQYAARSLVHASLGIVLAAGVSVVSSPLAVAALAAGTVCFLALEIVRLRVTGLGAWLNARLSLFMRPEEESTFTGASYFLIGSAFAAVAFPRELASLAILFLALGDPAAAAVGRWRGRTKCWGEGMEGNLACLAVCLLTGGLMTAILGQPNLAVAIAGAFAATVFQALPLRLNDNVTIPVGSALIMLATSSLIPATAVA